MDFNKKALKVIDIVNQRWRTGEKDSVCKAYEEEMWTKTLRAIYIEALENAAKICMFRATTKNPYLVIKASHDATVDIMNLVEELKKPI